MKNVLLLILDGFGIGKCVKSNAVYMANTPHIDSVLKNNPVSVLNASGLDVGLPEGQMGNSEVGHTNIGAGRVVYQDFTYINKSIEDGSFFENSELLNIIKYVKSKKSRLHIMGLVSDGGIHSHINHFYSVLKLAQKNGLSDVCIHAWTDGRDTYTKSASKYINDLEEFSKKIKTGKIETISGRFYSMDRDNHSDRTEKAFNAIVKAQGEIFESPEKAIQSSYNKDITDEFIVPCVRKDYEGFKNGDAVICLNFRPDRVRQITRKFLYDLDFKCKYCCFTQYDETFKDVSVAFKPREIKNTLGEYISSKGLNQLRIAETEKYAHVTFFFNGGKEKPYKNEDRIIINSPNVRTYDLKPEMSALEVANCAAENIRKQIYNLIVVNFANPDMVGHTGNMEATIKAVETVDKCVGMLINENKKFGGVTIITADHGNAEKMFDESEKIFTAHTSNPVIFVLDNYLCNLKGTGSLCDIAPTILDILGLEKPEEMTGQSLIIT